MPNTNRFVPLITVRHYSFATWRVAIGHPNAGSVSRVELYEHVGRRQDYVYDTQQRRVRIG